MTGEAARSPLIHVVDHVPHGWLLPRCAAAVHHGGAGTTAASTAAGIPTGIVPFFGDQPYWGGMCWCGVRPSVDCCCTRFLACMDFLLKTCSLAIGCWTLGLSLSTCL